MPIRIKSLPRKRSDLAEQRRAARMAALKREYERRDLRRIDVAFYASPAWRSLRAEFRAAHPLCERCEAADRVEPARHVHHRIDRKEQPELALAWSNLEALCHSCHSKHHASRSNRWSAGGRTGSLS